MSSMAARVVLTEDGEEAPPDVHTRWPLRKHKAAPYDYEVRGNAEDGYTSARLPSRGGGQHKDGLEAQLARLGLALTIAPLNNEVEADATADAATQPPGAVDEGVFTNVSLGGGEVPEVPVGSDAGEVGIPMK